MADFWYSPLQAGGAMLLLGGDVTLAVPSATGLTLTGLTPALSLTLGVPSGRTNASATAGRPHVSGGPPPGSWVLALGDSIAHGSLGNEWSVSISKELSGVDGIEVRVGEVPSTAATPVWTVTPLWIGIAIRGNPTTKTVGDYKTALAAVGITATVGGVADSDLLTGTSVNTHQFTGGTSNLTFAAQTPGLSRTLGVPSASALTLNGLAPALSMVRGVPSATGLVLTGNAPSLLTVIQETGQRILISPQVGVRIGLKIDPGIGG